MNRPDRLFVLIDGGTFSSAVLNAASLRRQTRATFAGEPPGDMPDHPGQPATLVLPNSCLTVGHSTKYFHSYAGISLEPDLPLAPTGADHFAGRDQVLQAIVE